MRSSQPPSSRGIGLLPVIAVGDPRYGHSLSLRAGAFAVIGIRRGHNSSRIISLGVMNATAIL